MNKVSGICRTEDLAFMSRIVYPSFYIQEKVPSGIKGKSRHFQMKEKQETLLTEDLPKRMAKVSFLKRKELIKYAWNIK